MRIPFGTSLCGTDAPPASCVVGLCARITVDLPGSTNSAKFSKILNPFRSPSRIRRRYIVPGAREEAVMRFSSWSRSQSLSWSCPKFSQLRIPGFAIHPGVCGGVPRTHLSAAPTQSSSGWVRVALLSWATGVRRQHVGDFHSGQR